MTCHESNNLSCRISHTNKDAHNNATGSTKKNGKINAGCDSKRQSSKRKFEVQNRVQDVIEKITKLK